MMRSLFSLLFLVCFLPNITFGQNPDLSDDEYFRQLQERNNNTTQNPDLSDDEYFRQLQERNNRTAQEQEEFRNAIENQDQTRQIQGQSTNPSMQDIEEQNLREQLQNGTFENMINQTSRQATPVPTGNNPLNQIVDSSIFGGQPLNQLFNQIFYIGLVAAVLLAIVMIIRGGVEYMTIDAIASKENGKKRVQAALGGLVLAFSAILILNTINPGLTSLEINFKSFKKIQGIQVEVLGITPGGEDIVGGQDGSIYVAGSGGLANTNSVIKGDFSSVTAADLRQHLGQNYTDADVQAFIDAGRQHNIDPRFLASISKFETGNGTSKAFTDGRNNAMGTSNKQGPIGFNSVREGIFAQANSLSRQGGYYDKANTIQQIGNIYSPAVNPKTGKPYENDINGTNWSWAGSVTANYDKMTKGDARTTTTLP